MAEPYTMRKPAKKLAAPLLEWYDRVHAVRDMPWRRTRDPYAIWLSETMLQQTQVETVKPYYAKFLARFPTVATLAAAPLEEVLALWAGLGYYRRARHLHAAARVVAKKHGGELPSDVDMLMDLPGIGRYTAGAVGSIAFGLPAAVVDGNVMRVLARLAGYDRDIGVAKNAAFFWELAGRVVRGAAGMTNDEWPMANEKGKVCGRYGDVNQALMELGATVCAPVNPRCAECPVRGFCRALAEGRVAELPVKSKRGETPEVRGMAVVLLRRQKTEVGRQKIGKLEVLLMKRPRGGIWEEMWEFPVLLREVGRERTEDRRQKTEDRRKEQVARSNEREVGIEGWILRELGIEVERAEFCGEVRHQLTHRLMRYEVAVCSAKRRRKEVRLPACVTGGEYLEARWVAWPVKDRALPMARVVGKIAERAQMLEQNEVLPGLE